MDEDEEMPDRPVPAPGSATLKYGEATLATADAKAAGVAAGNIQVLDSRAETLQLPEVVSPHACFFWHPVQTTRLSILPFILSADAPPYCPPPSLLFAGL